MSDIKALESAKVGTAMALEQFLDQVKFNEQGLVPAVAQDKASGVVLMLAWMNRESIEQTLTTGQVVYLPQSPVLVAQGRNLRQHPSPRIHAL